MVQSLHEIDIDSIGALFGTYAGNFHDLEPWTHGAEINHDGDLRLQYIAGWGINSRLENVIYTQMMKYRHPPVGMFTGSPERVEYMMQALGK